MFDSGFILGDGVWEGLRLYNGSFFCIDEHLERLYEACKMMDISMSLSPKQLKSDLNRLVEENGMRDNVHARLMVSRGEKVTPYQGPSVNLGPPSIVCIAEHKPSSAMPPGEGLHTVHVRRGYADVQDQKLNSHSKINCVTACIAAAKAGADEALMLDPHGQVATCNSVHFFIVRKGEVWTSGGNYCIPGITRGQRNQALPGKWNSRLRKRLFAVRGVRGRRGICDGNLAGVNPVKEVDGRRIGTGHNANWGKESADLPGPMVKKLRTLYQEMVHRECGSDGA